MGQAGAGYEGRKLWVAGGCGLQVPQGPGDSADRPDGIREAGRSWFCGPESAVGYGLFELRRMVPWRSDLRSLELACRHRGHDGGLVREHGSNTHWTVGGLNA